MQLRSSVFPSGRVNRVAILGQTPAHTQGVPDREEKKDAKKQKTMKKPLDTGRPR
jgi:hypothetical protein